MTVKELIALRGVQQKDLAAALNKAQNTVSQIVNGKQRLYFSDACIIADVLGVSLDELRAAFTETARQDEINDRP